MLEAKVCRKYIKRTKLKKFNLNQPIYDIKLLISNHTVNSINFTNIRVRWKKLLAWPTYHLVPFGNQMTKLEFFWKDFLVRSRYFQYSLWKAGAVPLLRNLDNDHCKYLHGVLMMHIWLVNWKKIVMQLIIYKNFTSLFGAYEIVIEIIKNHKH